MTIVGEAFVRIRPDDAGFSAEAEKGILSKVGGIAKAAAGVFAGAFVVKQGFDFLGGIIGDATESRRVLAETEQAIKATGGAANVSAKEVSGLADSLSKKTGIDDEAIQTGENLLLTFKGIRNETGKGNDIFNQATAAVLDLSKQFGGIEGSAVQVGKALNDPIAGITALGRAGVTFTDQQKEQIKALVETGDVLGAQKIILGEINAQVGGQAAAQATAADKLRVVWGNLREELGSRLLPIVDKVANFLAARLPGALDATGKALGPIAAQLGAFFKTLTTGFTEDEGTPVERFALMLRDTVFPVIVQVANFVRDNFQPILIGIGAAFLIAAGPVIAIGAALVLLYTRFQVVRDVIAAVADFLTGTVVPAIAAFAGFVAEQFGNLADFVRENWAGIQEAISHVIVVVQAIIEAFVTVVQAIWRAWGDELLNIVGIVWDQIRNIIDTVVGIISGLIRAGLAIINGDWGEAWDAIKDILSTAWDFIKETVSNAFRILREVVEGGISAVVAIVGDIPGHILDALGNLGELLVSAGEDLIRGLLQGIKNLAGAAADAAKAVVRGAVNAAKDFLGIGSPSKVFRLIGEQTMQGFALGLNGSAPAVQKTVSQIMGGVAGQWRDEINALGQSEKIFYPAGWTPAIGAANIAAATAMSSAGRAGGSASAPSSSPSRGPLIGQLVINAPSGDPPAIGAAVRQAVTQLVADGTVGRAMAKRSESLSRR